MLWHINFMCFFSAVRTNTDIKFGRLHGMRTLLVLTGVSSREDLPNLPDDSKPEFYTTSIGELISCRT